MLNGGMISFRWNRFASYDRDSSRAPTQPVKGKLFTTGTLRLLPEGADQSRARASDTVERVRSTGHSPDRSWQLVLFPVRPQVLDRIQLRRVAGQKLQPQPSPGRETPTPPGCDVPADRPAQLAGNVRVRCARNRMRRSIARKRPEVEVPPLQPRPSPTAFSS